MDCWIGIVQDGDRLIVRLAGRLSMAQVSELLGACGERRNIDIDLSELVSADAAGINVLQRIRAAGAKLVGAPGYIQMKLDSPAEGLTGTTSSAGRTRPR